MIVVEWGNPEKSFIECRFVAPWDWHEYRQADADMQALLESSTGPVDLIMDFSAGRELPGNILSNVRSGGPPGHANLRTTVLVNISPLLQVIGGILAKLYPGRAPKVIPVKTRAEALVVLNRQQIDRQDRSASGA
jgi:hypothetical protein